MFQALLAEREAGDGGNKMDEFEEGRRQVDVDAESSFLLADAEGARDVVVKDGRQLSQLRHAQRRHRRVAASPRFRDRLEYSNVEAGKGCGC